MAKGLYIHIPFCRSICTYCDFPKLAGATERIREYMQALLSEIEHQRTHLQDLETIYIGGGTPSSIGIPALSMLFSALKKSVDFSNIREFTIEANPEDITEEFAEFLSNHPLNRISLGVETGHPRLLKILGRKAGKEQVRTAIDCLRRHGIDNINLDFIYAIPSETMQDLEEDIEYAISLHPTHLSFYSLILEERTLLQHQVEKKEIMPLDIEDEADQFERVMKELPKAGYAHYEISNFALPEHKSLHNLLYWNLSSYLGVGMGAHSQIEERRFHNHPTLQKYLDAVNNTGVGTESEDSCDLVREFGIMGLRKVQGISVKEFHHRFNRDLFDTFPLLNKNMESGLLILEGDNLRLSPRGIMVMNYVEKSFME